MALFLSSGCQQDEAQRIVNRSIDAHGGDRFLHSKIEFDFRNRHYTAHRDRGLFTYIREFTDTTGQVKDILNNEGFTRLVNEEEVNITDERKQAFTNSVNGVIYFAMLPFRLNDPSVRKHFDGETVIKDKGYFIIRVTFEGDNHDEDHEDIFLFWINKENYRLDYFAYSYTSEGGGIRFREATGTHEVNGIILQDYNNYAPETKDVRLEDMEDLFKNNSLQKLSVINLENVTVDYSK